MVLVLGRKYSTSRCAVNAEETSNQGQSLLLEIGGGKHTDTDTFPNQTYIPFFMPYLQGIRILHNTQS